MSVNENDKMITYTLPSLFKLACLACTPAMYLKYSTKFKNLCMDVQPCCKELDRTIKRNAVDGIFNPLGDRKLMYLKVVAIEDKTITTELLNSAIKHGHIECLKMGYEFGYPLTMDDDDLDGVMGLYRLPSKIKWTPDMCSIGVCYRLSEYLQYAHQQGFLWNESNCIAADLSDDLAPLKNAVLEYLHERGCPSPIETCPDAATGGHLECLKFVRANESRREGILDGATVFPSVVCAERTLSHGEQSII